MIFAREITGPLTSLVKKIDEANDKQGKKMGSFVVFCSDEEKLQDNLKELAEKEKIKHVAFTIDNPSGPDGYKIHKEADITVVLYVNKTVKINHAFKKGELNPAAIRKVLAELPKILEDKE